jgi:hypothetical protein
MAEILQGGKRDLTGQTTNFTVTSFSEDYTIASNEGTAGNIAAVLTTLIRDLIRKGIVNGTVV